ncbi:MAG: hypothetical protein GC145_14555 [Caulobacter sp.]|nr:hypothetical protein [Caulobacter sp.]
MPATSALTVIEGDRAEPVPAEQVFDVPISKIRVGQRLRELDHAWATALAGIMDAEGQKDPIRVYAVPGTDEFDLGRGLHRLTARQLGGHATVRAFILDGATAIDRRADEVSENLWRKGLDPLERAAFVAELYELQRLRAGLDASTTLQSVAAKARWEQTLKADAGDANLKLRVAYGFSDDIAEKLGLSVASVYRDLHLHKSLAPDVAAAIRALPVAQNASQLRALAKLPQEQQRRVAGQITQGRAKAVTDAVAALSGAVKPSPDKKRLSAFIGAWARMSLAERKAALETLQGMDLPKGWSVQHG